MGRPRDEWRSEVSARYRALEQFSKEDARLQFLRILRSLPYGEPRTLRTGLMQTFRSSVGLLALSSLSKPVRGRSAVSTRSIFTLVITTHGCQRLRGFALQ